MFNKGVLKQGARGKISKLQRNFPATGSQTYWKHHSQGNSIYLHFSAAHFPQQSQRPFPATFESLPKGIIGRPHCSCVDLLCFLHLQILHGLQHLLGERVLLSPRTCLDGCQETQIVFARSRRGCLHKGNHCLSKLQELYRDETYWTKSPNKIN